MQPSIRRINHHRHQPRNHPGPWPQSVMRDVEPERRAQRVLLILGAEHALRHISASTWFGSGIPCQPPLHAQINDESQYRQSPKRIRSQAAMKVWQERYGIRGFDTGRANIVLDHLQMHLQSLHPSNLRYRNPSQHNNHGHLQGKLKQVGDQHAPKPADKRVESGKRNQNKDAYEHRRISRIAQRVLKNVSADGHLQHPALSNHGAEQNRDDADHGLRHPSQNEAIHEKAEIDSLESAQKRRWLSPVAKFDQLDVGQYFSPPPIAREEENRHHAADAGTPPDPISRDALPGNQPTNQQGRVGGKSGGHHRSPSQPPGNIAARDEKLFRVPASPAAVVKTNQQIDQQVPNNDDPVRRSKGHEFSVDRDILSVRATGVRGITRLRVPARASTRIPVCRLKSQQIIEDVAAKPTLLAGRALGTQQAAHPSFHSRQYSGSFRYQRGSRGWRAWPW